MISLLILINTNLKDQMDNNLKGIDMVVGAKGSPLQLILSGVYHVDSPLEIFLKMQKPLSKIEWLFVFHYFMVIIIVVTSGTNSVF